VTGDPELLAFRRGYYLLLAAVLRAEPGPDLLAAVSEGLEDRIAGCEGLQPLMAEGWRELRGYLAGRPPERLAEAVAEEYTALFLWPSAQQLHPYESYYLVGRVLDRPLAVLRDSLTALGLARDTATAEPEDFLAFELEAMGRLLDRQAEAATPEAERLAVDAQATFLKRHLLVWGPAAARDLGRAQVADFYRGIGKVLEGFLALEADLLGDWGDETRRTIEEARRAFAGTGQWRGPLLEGTPGPEEPDPA
jgi:TorA maturation chaperone TorD